MYVSLAHQTTLFEANFNRKFKMAAKSPMSVILKICSRRTSDDVTSVTVESGMVENVGVAFGISLLSYSLTEIQSTFGVLTAILFLQVT